MIFKNFNLTYKSALCSRNRHYLRRPVKNSGLSGRAHQQMMKATGFGISIQSFFLWLPSRTDQVQPPNTVNIFFLVLLFM